MKNLLKNHKYILILSLLFLTACATTQTSKQSYIYNAKGEMYLKIGKYNKAEKLLNKAIEANPYNLEAYRNRGTLYYNLGDFEKALKDFDYVLSYEEKDSQTLSAKGALLANMGKYNEAYQNLYEALKLNPSNVAALNSVAGLLYISGDFKKAKDIYTISLNYKTSPEVYLMRAKCFAQLGDTEEADKDYAMAALLERGTGNTAPAKQ